MILVSSPASRRSFSIFAASISGLVPFITSVPSPIGTANIVVAVNTLIARGLPRVPRTIHRHVELFSQIQDIAYVCARRCDRRCQVSGDAFWRKLTKDEVGIDRPAFGSGGFPRFASPRRARLVYRGTARSRNSRE